MEFHKVTISVMTIIVATVSILSKIYGLSENERFKRHALIISSSWALLKAQLFALAWLILNFAACSWALGMLLAGSSAPSKTETAFISLHVFLLCSLFIVISIQASIAWRTTRH